MAAIVRPLLRRAWISVWRRSFRFWIRLSVESVAVVRCLSSVDTSSAERSVDCQAGHRASARLLRNRSAADGYAERSGRPTTAPARRKSAASRLALDTETDVRAVGP